jgi:transketolase
MRDKFAETLNELARDNEDIVVLAADISPVGKMNEFVKNNPKKFLNVGVAEQSMIGIAAGLAMGGFLPFCYTIATFSLLRPFEFVRNDLGYQDLPVVIVGMGAGLSYPSLGFTHHAQEDIAVCSTVPNLEVWTPCDPNSVEFAINMIVKKREHPSYLRLGKAGEPNLKFASDYQPKLGYGRFFFEVAQEFDVYFLTYGTITKQVTEAATKLQENGISSQVLSVLQISPEFFPEIFAVLPKNAKVIVVEEHIAPGGFGAQLSLYLMNSAKSIDFLHICLPTIPSHLYGSTDWLLQQLGLSSICISQKVMNFLKTRSQ